MPSFRACIIAGVFAALTVPGAPAGGQQATTFNHDPDAARIVTSDIPNFWRAYDGATLLDAADRFQRIYLDPGSAALPEFYLTGRSLAAAVASRPRFYASIRASTLALDTDRSMADSIRAAFRHLKARYPDAVFPDVYFFVGRLNTGGTVGAHGLLMGAEMHVREAATPVDELSDWERGVIDGRAGIPHIVAHELVHFQQLPDSKDKPLLSRALHEGCADLVGELISGGHINARQHEYGAAHERALWEEFRTAMHGTDANRWLYNGSTIKDRPSDLGYYVGYRICRAYYERAGDKDGALRQILRMDDADRFLMESGYAP